MLNHELEPTKSLTIEQGIISGETIFETRTSLRRLVDLEDDPAGLMDIPFIFTVRRIADAKVFIASFPAECALKEERFCRVLNAAKLYPLDQEIGAIEGDLWLFDPQMRANSELFSTLWQKHQVLGDDFFEFGNNHFDKFFRAITANKYTKEFEYSEEMRKRLGYIPAMCTIDKALEEEGLDRLLSSNDVGYPALVRFFIPRGDPIHQLTQLQTAVKTGLISVLKQRDFFLGGPPYLPVHNILLKMPDEERTQLLRDLYSGLSHDEKRGLIEYLYNAVRRDKKILISPDDSTDTIYWQTHALRKNSGRTIKKLADGRIESRIGNSFILYEPKFSEQGEVSFEVLGEHIEVEPNSGLIPLIVWQKNTVTGEKTYWCDSIPEKVTNLDPEHFSQQHDTLFGQIVVAAYSPDVRKTLPTELCLEAGGYPQQMKAAQTPFTCRLFSNRFLQEATVILGLESMV